MAGPESRLWSEKVALLKNFGKIKRLEDALEKGVPDTIYCLRWMKEPPRAGWCELKRLRHWPVRAQVRLPHFTMEQADFLVSWGKAGMGAYLLAQVDRTFLVWHWRQVHAIQAGLRSNEFRMSAQVCEEGQFPVAKVLRCLTQI